MYVSSFMPYGGPPNASAGTSNAAAAIAATTKRKGPQLTAGQKFPPCRVQNVSAGLAGRAEVRRDDGDRVTAELSRRACGVQGADADLAPAGIENCSPVPGRGHPQH